MLTDVVTQMNQPAVHIWTAVLPGIGVRHISMQSSFYKFPVICKPSPDEYFAEAFFCRTGSILITRYGGPIALGDGDILLLSGQSRLNTVQITSPVSGILVSIRDESALDNLESLNGLLGSFDIHSGPFNDIMEKQHGCTVAHSSVWSRAVFTTLDELSGEDCDRYCVLKVLELLFLLNTHCALLEAGTEKGSPNSYLIRTVAEMQEYMEHHLDEKLTIDAMSQRFHISPTAFKSAFRRVYGIPVHRWLQTKRLHKAADLLYSTPMTVLQIAQMVGYDGVSQFNVAFRRLYGMSPREFRKISDSGLNNPIPAGFPVDSFN